MKRIFTTDGKDIALLKLAMENNAMLRMVLSNQVLIMQAFKIDRHLPMPFPDQIIDDIGNPDKELRDYLVAIDQVTNEVIRRTWDYAVDNDGSLDIQGEIGLTPA